MPGLVVGLLVRHQDRAGDLLDSWLSRPEIWALEAARASGEGRLHVQGPDPDDLPGRDRRRASFREVAASMTVQAVLDADQDRLAELGAIEDELVRRSQELAAGEEGADQYLATVQGWAALFRPENHHPRLAENGVIIEYQHPEEVARRLAPKLDSFDRVQAAFRLEAAYAIPLAEGRAVPVDLLLEDLAAARDLADRPPENSPVAIVDPVAAVAATAVIAHAQKRIVVPLEELKWSAGIIIEVAAGFEGHPLDAQHCAYPIGADRTSASALPSLLLAQFDGAQADPAALRLALERSATSVPDEVRIIFARATAPVWASPCLPAMPSGPCRHQLLWEAAMKGLRDCQLGDWNNTTQRRLIAPIGEPFAESWQPSRPTGCSSTA